MSRAASRTFVALGLAGIFAAGCVTGVCAAAWFVHHRMHALHGGGPHAIEALGVEWLGRELDLDDAQEAELAQILRDAHLELFRFKSRHNDELLAIVHPALERIDALLTPEQAARWSPLRAHVVEHAAATVETISND